MQRKTLSHKPIFTLITALVLTMLLLLALAGCGGGSGPQTQQPSAGSTNQGNQGGGGSADTGVEWPDNEYTSAIPKPGMAATSCSENDGGFSAMFEGVEFREARAYGDALKAAGVTVDLNIFDEVEEYGMYMYMAGTGTGYFIDFQWHEGVGATLLVEKVD